MASDGDFCQKAVNLEQKVGQRMASWHQKKIAKTLDLQGFVRCRTTIVNRGLGVRFPSPAPRCGKPFGLPYFCA